MDLSLSLSLSVKEKQTNTIKQLVKIDAPAGLDFFYEKYLENTYHFVKFDVNNDKMACYKIANIFSKSPDLFLGQKRTEIQLDDESVTLSTNDWIKCEQLPDIILDFTVEYYIYTVNRFPVIIFFRINKNIDDYEFKLKGFIDCLIGIKQLTGNTLQTMIEENKDNKDNKYDKQYIEYHTPTQIMDVECDTKTGATVAFANVATKGTYVTVLICGVIITYFFVDSITNQEPCYNDMYHMH